MKFLIYSLAFAAMAGLVFGSENEKDPYDVAESLIKHADALKEYAEQEIQKYQNNSHYHLAIIRLEHEIHRVEAIADQLRNMTKMENMTEHYMHHFHQIEMELLIFENIIEEELYYLEHGHHHHDHHDHDHHDHDHHHHDHDDSDIIAGDDYKDALLKKAQQLIDEAEDAIKKYGQGKDIDVQVIKSEVVIIKNLVKQINEANNPQALAVLESNLAQHEEIIRKWLDDIEPHTTHAPVTIA
ncbi:uncharacterized protein LOC124490046 [Dermatophagoides farinae]|uniref:uncharacterized protein LOC124490046 n=1 Tax=Dermatophagoides farinae TaxID=6954 RepID=UPI003F5EF6A7